MKVYEKTIIDPVYVVMSGGWITADGPDNSWYADAADFAAQRGLMSGVGENLFGGSQNTTRAEMAVMLQQFVKLTEK